MNPFLVCVILCLVSGFQFCACSIRSDADLPLLVFPGFAWAENLVFDGLGNLFVSDDLRGEIWSIRLVDESYEGAIFLCEGIEHVAGLQVSPDGSTLYAGVTLSDGRKGIIAANTNAATSSIAERNSNETAESAEYKFVAGTSQQPNGFMIDFLSSTAYYTFEGNKTDAGGVYALSDFDGDEPLEKFVATVSAADGLWLDEKTQLLYVGHLVEMKVSVFDASNGLEGFNLVGEFPAISNSFQHPHEHLLDDLTLLNHYENDEASDPEVRLPTQDISQISLLGADWMGKAVLQFKLDGSEVRSIPPPTEVGAFYQVTSMRWGKGPGFDPNSLYVTEGGGLRASQTNRRVIQIRNLNKK